MTALKIAIVQFVEPYQPGIVRCEFTDAEGAIHSIVDKEVYFSSEFLDEDSGYPQPGIVRCEVLARWRDTSGRELARINIAQPDALQSTEGLEDFVVLAAQLDPSPWWVPGKELESIISVVYTGTQRFVRAMMRRDLGDLHIELHWKLLRRIARIVVAGLIFKFTLDRICAQCRLRLGDHNCLDHHVTGINTELLRGIERKARKLPGRILHLSDHQVWGRHKAE